MFAQRQANATPQDFEEEDQATRRVPFIAPAEDEPPESSDKVALFTGKPIVEPDAPPDEATLRRHSILMETLDEEGDRQREERFQAQMDDDYYHHLQWTAEDAAELALRGQAPLVFNESRTSIDWLCGTERKLRKDYKIRPRERNDEQGAELKTKVFKYTDDVNLGPWHRSRTAKDMFTSGLGWLEEAINTDPDKERIFCGYEDWRRIFRDSRGREFDLGDARYLHRRKILDLDYAMALLPKGARHLQATAGRWGTDDDEADEVWYLGQRLTNAHTVGLIQTDGLFGDDYTVRASGSAWDRGRRNTVELLESWYRVPESVQIFGAGPLAGKVVNPAEPAHVQLINDRTSMYSAVKMRMRVMVGTKYAPIWDGPSPFRHGKFLLVPFWGYRRGRDGLVYGQMRGMRDPQDDLNKRKSKALHILSSNRVTITTSAVEDVEEFRQEVARADGVLVVDNLQNMRVEKPMGDAQMNLEMAKEDQEHIRNSGGVTGENLGEHTSADSGRAIIAKQSQGGMVTYELFDNFFLGFKLAGQLRLSHIEQFCNQQWEFRIDPEHSPSEWVSVNEPRPDGTVVNDITATQADFIVDQQDYRATLTQAAMDSVFELLGKMATFAPQLVLNLLDLAVDSSDVPAKSEWVARIRKMNGQRDPSKPPTPEEQAADQSNMQKQQAMEQITMETAQAKLDEIKSKINNTNADKVLKSLQALLSAVEAAATISTIPGVAVAADGLAKAAGFEDATPQDTIIARPQIAPQSAPGADTGFPQLPAPTSAQPDAIV